MKLLVVNGPNLNFLGIREKQIYGSKTYFDLVSYIKELGKLYNVGIQVEQTNYEGKVVDLIQQAYHASYDGIIINPGALTHYSYAIYDAIKGSNIPTVEVHLTDINNREEFRKQSVIRSACVTHFLGQGFESYHEAIKFLIKR
jgi:3-dehydroquinate dehydratase II